PPAALMAPPPVARPKDGPGASRLKAVTKEIVEKIVSRVLVGQNAKGMAEFRIDLKSDVLKGLTIKVSGGRGGKIRAVFSGTDREALQALKQTSGELVKALASRGLSLEELEFEET
ncbi:MAG: flagellar hook-length control protein FliK, partial [Myxococcales bacterium]